MKIKGKFTVRKDLRIRGIYGGTNFVKGMEGFKGKEVTVNKYYNNGKFSIRGDKEEFCFTIDMMDSFNGKSLNKMRVCDGCKIPVFDKSPISGVCSTCYDETYKICPKCKKTALIRQFKRADRKNICISCFKRNYFECGCGSRVQIKNAKVVGGAYYCKDCAKETPPRNNMVGGLMEGSIPSVAFMTERELKERFKGNKFALLIERLGMLLDGEDVQELARELKCSDKNNTFEMLESIFNKCGIYGKIPRFMWCGE